MKRFTRISIRTLLILITVFGVWLAVQANSAHRQREAVAWVKANGGHVRYDWEYDGDFNPFKQKAEHPAPKWLRDLVGDEYFQDVVGVASIEVEVTDLTPLGNLKKLEELDISETQVTDFTPLENLTNLKRLWLDGTPVTDAQVKQLQQALPNCEIY